MRNFLFVLFLFICSAVIFAQEQNKGNDVELPSFVITGKATETFTPLIKPGIEPVFIPLTGITGGTPAGTFKLNKQFDIPFEPEKKVKKDSVAEPLYNRFTINAGNISTPSFEMLYTSFFKDGRMTFEMNGTNQRDYVKDANEYLIAPALGVKFSVGDGVDFPLSNVDTRFAYRFNSFNHYGFTDSLVSVKSGRFTPQVEFSTSTDNSMWVDLGLGADILTVNAYKLKSTSANSVLAISLGGNNLRITGSASLLGGKGGYGGIEKSFSFFEAKSDITLQFTGFRLKAGAYYANDGDAGYFNPTAIAELPFGAGISLFGGYGGKVLYFTPGDMFSFNRYASSSFAAKHTQRLEHTIEAGISILRKDLLDITVSAQYNKVPGYLYLQGTGSMKTFSLNVKKADVISSSAKMVLFFGKTGTFSADLKYNRLSDADGSVFPFVPALSGTSEFYYMFNTTWSAAAGVQLQTESYSDFTNTGKNSGLISPYLHGYYKTGPGMEFGLLLDNVLNRKNAPINGMLLPGFEVNVHFRYVW